MSDLIFTIDLDNEGRSYHATIAHKVIMNFAQGKLLIQRSMRRASLHYFNKAMILANRISLPEYQYLLAYEYYKMYSIVNFDKKKAEFYHKMMNEQKAIMDAELQVKQYEGELVGIISQNVDLSVLRKKSKRYGELCLSIINKYFSYQMYISAFQVIVFYYNVHNELDKVVEMIEDAKRRLSSMKLLNPGAEYIINDSYIKGLITSHNFEEAEEAIKTLTVGVSNGPRSFTRSRLLFSVLVRLKKYEEASKVTRQALSKKEIKVYRRSHELFLIKKGYIHLLVELGVFESESKEFSKITPYKLNKLINQISILSKDKTGINASLRILEMSFFIVRKSTDNLIDRIDSVRQYAYKYLRKDDNLRFRIFFRFLIKCQEQRFNVQAIKRHTRDLRVKLNENPQLLLDSVVDVEIIPLEDLWDYLIEYIENNY